jgi:hypothetical protein
MRVRETKVEGDKREVSRRVEKCVVQEEVETILAVGWSCSRGQVVGRNGPSSQKGVGKP